MRIVLDAMGTDDHPQPEIGAAKLIVETWPDELTLVGPEPALRQQLQTAGVDLNRIRLVHAPEVLRMTDKPADSARGKPTSSMSVGIQLVADGEADAFVSCGNTGGVLANAILRLGRIRGVKRPGLTAVFPVRTGRAIVSDIGANTDCKPEYLLQFAALGSVYAKRVLGVERPRVGLMSNGEEAGKGNELIHEATPMLAASNLHFIGNVEPKEVYAGAADVVVCDGFIGNIFLKSSEAVAAFLVDLIRKEITGGPLTAVGGLLARPAFRKVGAVLDPEEHGAATLLGVDGLVYIGHGRFGPTGVFNAVRVARSAVEADLLEGMRQAIQTQLAGLKQPAPDA